MRYDVGRPVQAGTWVGREEYVLVLLARFFRCCYPVQQRGFGGLTPE
jgi:hypothetical protein